MKKIITCISVVCIAIASKAQVKPVKDISMAMSQGVHQGFRVIIPESNMKDAYKTWDKLMRDYGAKTSKVSKSDDYLSEEALIPSIEQQAITIYVNFSDSPEGVIMNAFFRRGESYLNASEHPQKAIAARGLLKKFAVNVAAEAVSKKVVKETKEMEKLEREQKNLEKAKEGYEREIKKAKEDIEKNEKNIEVNAEDQVAKKREIEEQRKRLKAAEDKARLYK
jgi:hypothetical protein